MEEPLSNSTFRSLLVPPAGISARVYHFTERAFSASVGFTVSVVMTSQPISVVVLTALTMAGVNVRLVSVDKPPFLFTAPSRTFVA